MPGQYFLKIMSVFTPLFPLGLVVYPGEEVHLHIFEPRYKQLIQDCAENDLAFGIPTVLDKKVSEYGTLVRLREITKVHDGGELDVIVDGLEVFCIQGPLQLAPDKLYSAAEIDFPENETEGDPKLMREIVASIKQLHATLKVNKTFDKKASEMCSYDVAHHAGFSVRDEYQVLRLLTELERQAFLQAHLLKVLPIALEMQALKDRVSLNGHFRMTGGVEWQDLQ